MRAETLTKHALRETEAKAAACDSMDQVPIALTPHRLPLLFTLPSSKARSTELSGGRRRCALFAPDSVSQTRLRGEKGGCIVGEETARVEALDRTSLLRSETSL